MKKFLVTLVAAAMVAVSASAEEFYGAEEGGFAITFNANPLVNFVGNMFNGTQNNKIQDFNGLKNPMFGGTTITGKYMLKDNMAIDLGFGFDNNYDVDNNYEDSKDLEKKTSFKRTSKTDFMLKGGIQYLLRPGKRLQPTLGLDLVYAHKNNFTFYEDEANDNTYYTGNPTNALGLMGSVGVEYFLFKQVSVGATVDFAIAKAWTRESRDYSNYKSGNYSRVSETSTMIKTGNLGGNLSLNFYF